MKPVSVEEAIAEIEEVLEENEISPDENVVRAVPTGPVMPLLPTPTSENPEVEQLYQNAVERHIHAHGEPPNPFQAVVLRLHAETETGLTTLQSPVGPVTSPDAPTELSLEEITEKLEQQTEESIYQECLEGYARFTGEPPSQFIRNMLKVYASMNYRCGQYLLNRLQNPQTEICPTENRDTQRVEVGRPDTEFQLAGVAEPVYFQNRPPVEICPVEREQLDRYGQLFDVSREEGETDEAYRERIRQRAYPHLT